MQRQMKEENQMNPELNVLHPNTIDLREECDELCLKCLHTSICIIRTTSESAIFYCEEYLGNENLKVPAGSPVHLSQAMETGGIENSTAALGLCVDCDNRETCTLRGPGICVWHCEEYR
jgi:hypothetical protein